MKYKGNVVRGLREVIEVIPLNGVDIGFIFKAVVNEEFFEKVSPEPQPPKQKNVKTGQTLPNFTDPTYLKAQSEWGTRKTNWMFLESMKDTPDFEWETVVLNDPGTWHNWVKELEDSGFGQVDIQRLLNAFARAQGLDERMVEEARKRFLTSREAPASNSLSQTGENQSILSGEPAKGSESALPESK